jgi:hypothetical protein
MSAEHGDERQRSHEPGYSPYGVAGQRTGELACILQLRLVAPGEPLPYGPGDTPRWTDDDRLAFGYLLDFDDSLHALDQVIGTPSVHDRLPELSDFDVAHPYAGGYWSWIKNARDAAWGLTPEQAYELVKRGGSFPYEEQFIRLRQRKQTDGEQFAHRWTTWRRRLAPLDDPHFHRDVREGLDTIIAYVLSNGPRSAPTPQP